MSETDGMASRRALLAGAMGVGGASMLVAAAGPAGAVAIPTEPDSLFVLEVDGIPGESTLQQYPDAIDLLAWSFGGSVPPTSGGRRRAAPELADFVFISRLSKASPKLFEAMVLGRVVRSMHLHALRAGGEAAPFSYLDVLLENVSVVGDDVAPGEQDGYPLEVTRTRYEKITYTYRRQNADGAPVDEVTMTYDARRRA